MFLLWLQIGYDSEKTEFPREDFLVPLAIRKKETILMDNSSDPGRTPQSRSGYPVAGTPGPCTEGRYPDSQLVILTILAGLVALGDFSSTVSP